MIFWHTVRAATGRMEVIEAYHTLEDAIKDMAILAWEEPSNCYADYLMDEQTGEAVAVAIFGPEMELIVTCADGRHLTFSMPESYSKTD
jgi:hypothetical protein